MLWELVLVCARFLLQIVGSHLYSWVEYNTITVALLELCYLWIDIVTYKPLDHRPSNIVAF